MLLRTCRSSARLSFWCLPVPSRLLALPALLHVCRRSVAALGSRSVVTDCRTVGLGPFTCVTRCLL